MPPNQIQAPKKLQPLLKHMGTTPIPQGHRHNHTIDTVAVFPCITSILPKHGIQLFTDGSSMKGTDGSNVIGAGVYNATTNSCTRINPGGRAAPTPTIERNWWPYM